MPISLSSKCRLLNPIVKIVSNVLIRRCGCMSDNSHRCGDGRCVIDKLISEDKPVLEFMKFYSDFGDLPALSIHSGE